MSLYKRGSVYWYDFILDGVRYQGSTKLSDKRKAGDVEDEKRLKLARERDARKDAAQRFGVTPAEVERCQECEKWFDARYPVTGSDGEALCGSVCRQIREKRQTPTPTVSKFAERFRKKMEADHANKPKTVTYYTNGLKQLERYPQLANAALDQVDDQLISGYTEWRRVQKKRNGKQITIATVNREREVLRRMLRLAAQWKLIPGAPTIRRMEGEQARERIVTHEEERNYLRVTKQPLRDIATLIVDTGMRPEEVFRMRWENLHLKPTGEGKFGHVFNPYGKTKYARRNIPLTARVKALLEMRHEAQDKPKDGWAFPAPTKTGRVESVKSQHRRALKDSKVKPFVLYSLRHTMLTRLGESGGEAFTIQKIAGHSSAVISQRYVHPTPALIESAFSRFEAYNATKTAELAKEVVQ
jgi:integrase